MPQECIPPEVTPAMSLWLSPTDLDRHAVATRALLSPLECPDPATWRRTVTDALRTLFRAWAAMLIVPEAEGVVCHCDDVEPATLRAFMELPGEIGAGAIHLRDRGMEALFQRFRRQGTGTWSTEQMDSQSLRLLARSAFFNEVLVPNGLGDAVGMWTALPRGESLAWVSYRNPGQNPFVGGGQLLLRTLLPALKAGLALLGTAERARGGFAAMVDALPDALLLADARGRTLHRSRALRATLEADPEGARILAEMEDGACGLALARRGDDRALAAACREVTTASGGYRLHAGYLGAEVLGAEGIVVRLERIAPLLPSAPALQERWRLTPREAEVALCLAAGCSNKRTAAALGIRPSTVRHHAERVFGKLGLHSRKAMALELLQQGGNRPPIA